MHLFATIFLPHIAADSIIAQSRALSEFFNSFGYTRKITRSTETDAKHLTGDIETRFEHPPYPAEEYTNLPPPFPDRESLAGGVSPTRKRGLVKFGLGIKRMVRDRRRAAVFAGTPLARGGRWDPSKKNRPKSVPVLPICYLEKFAP